MTGRSVNWIRDLGDGRIDSLMAVGVAIAVALGLQLERVFISTMIFVVDQSNRTELARNALATFCAIGLAAILVRFLSVEWALALGLVILAGSRVIVQFSSDPELRWPIAAIGFIGWGWLSVTLSLRNRPVLAVGVVLGLLLDLSLRSVFDSIDLAQMRSPLKDVVSLLLVVAMVISLTVSVRSARKDSSWSAPDPSLLGLGAGIGIYALVTGNLGLPMVNVSVDPRTAFVLLAIGPLAVMTADVLSRKHDPRSRVGLSPRYWTVLTVLAGFISIHLVARSAVTGVAFSLALVAASFCCMSLTMASVRGSGQRTSQPQFWKAATYVMLGLLVHGASVFLYFASSGSPNWVIPVYVMLAFAGLMVLRSSEERRFVYHTAPPLAAIASAIALVALLTTQSGQVSAPQLALTRSFTVVTYNIQNGFSRDNRWDLEATARTIESLDADIVFLQEAGRGWFALGWSDQVGWLSQRLNMQMVFGPASEDNLWGNAILSVAPLSSEEVIKYTSSQNLTRGVVSAMVATEGDDLWVASTHLDNPADADDVRIDQTRSLIEFWDGREPALIGGDFNMTPEEEAILMIQDAGLVDAAAAIGQEVGTSESGRRIDYVFVSPGVLITFANVPDVATSDHRPVAIGLQIE